MSLLSVLHVEGGGQQAGVALMVPRVIRVGVRHPVNNKAYHDDYEPSPRRGTRSPMLPLVRYGMTVQPYRRSLSLPEVLYPETDKGPTQTLSIWTFALRSRFVR